MPWAVTMIAVKNEMVSRFIESKEYKGINEDFIFREIKNDEGLFMMFNRNKSITSNICSTLKEQDYLLIDVDDEDRLCIEGGWSNIPQYIQVPNQMMFLIKSESKEDIFRNKGYYNIDVLKNLPKNEIQNIYDIQIKYGDWDKIPDSDNCEGSEKQKLKRFEKVFEDTDCDDIYAFGKKWSFFELDFDTSKSDDGTCIVTFEPTLRKIIKYKDVIEDELQEIVDEEGEDNVAWSVFDTVNYELIQEFDEDLFNHPIIECENYRGHPDFPENWELDETK